MTTNFNFQNENKFDAIVIGSGMSGGIAAKELSQSGLKTLSSIAEFLLSRFFQYFYTSTP